MNKLMSSIAAAATYLTATILGVAVVAGFCFKTVTLPRRPAGRRPRHAVTTVRACPDWCTVRHTAADVEHASAALDLAALSRVGGAIAAQLLQAPGGPVRLGLAVVEPDDEAQETDIEISLQEAAQLAHGLTQAIAAARSAAN